MIAVIGFLLVVPCALLGMLVGALGGKLAYFVGLDALVYPIFLLGMVGGFVAWPFVARAMVEHFVAEDERGDML